eukprot:353143-Chlamydomonas_euryale.AAC.3
MAAKRLLSHRSWMMYICQSVRPPADACTKPREQAGARTCIRTCGRPHVHQNRALHACTHMQRGCPWTCAQTTHAHTSALIHKYALCASPLHTRPLPFTSITAFAALLQTLPDSLLP